MNVMIRSFLGLTVFVLPVVTPLTDFTATAQVNSGQLVTEASDKDMDEYREKPTRNTKLRILAEHRVIARYEGIEYQVCRGRTERCPETCGDSGERAVFTVTEYLHYAKPGQYGDKQQTEYRVQVSDFNRNRIGIKELNAVIAELTPGDSVLLEWNQRYGEVSPGVTASVRPVLHLKKLTAADVKELQQHITKNETEQQAKQDIVSVLALDATERIVISYAPKADLSADDVFRFEITEAAAIQNWLQELGRIPAKGPGMRAKLAFDAAEYRIEFMKGETALGFVRMKAGSLDSPGIEGWDFYRNEDRAFVEIVEAACQKAQK